MLTSVFAGHGWAKPPKLCAEFAPTIAYRFKVDASGCMHHACESRTLGP